MRRGLSSVVLVQTSFSATLEAGAGVEDGVGEVVAEDEEAAEEHIAGAEEEA